jgi:hypothetical protein
MNWRAMDLKQKYTEDSEAVFVAEDGFLESIKSLFTISEAMRIWVKLEDSVVFLPIRDLFPQKAGMVVHDIEGNPKFLELDYIKEEPDWVVMLDIREVDSDNYLDKILSNEHIPI